MIKLNNKNITYVALADSNNSIKAPKEIWYADSNNSVKLVYRRKDALIEGDDYEKYHWLNGRNGAYINTEHLVKTYEDVFEVYAKYDGTLRNPDGSEQNIFGTRNSDITIASYIDGSNNINAVIKQTTGPNNYNINTHKEVFKFTLYAPNSSEYVKILDGVSYTNPIGGTVNNDTNLKMYVFARNGKADSYFHGDIAYFKITDTSSNTTKMNLIPCKLLKPVPKWLDANGIRRQVGECGMIDLVSGKFYGNVNSVGTFTVENYYERKEWLQGDGTAYIDTNIIVDVPSLYISTSFTKREGRTTPLFGSRDLITTNGSQIWYLSDGNLRLDIITNGTDYVNVDSNDIQSYNQLIVDCSNNVVSVNETTFSSDVDNLSIKNSSNTFKIFSLEVLNNPNTYNKPYNGAFGNFIFKDDTHSLNLIPCTLTMDLPASMDANNIARTKGTSGMWDLVSDKFYGNVANSGTFKAVNLAEGVDYEVHQWLKGDGNAYIDTNIPLKNISNYSIKVYIMDLNHSGGIFGARISAYDDVNLEVIVYRSDSLSLGIDFGNYEQNRKYRAVQSNNQYEIEWSNGELSINNENIATIQYTTSSEMTAKLFASQNYTSADEPRIFRDKIASLVISGVIDLIPVKLLRSIPSTYDANGIARQAGECGMYDTVNDIFYGNVASSGSFSVSDDN